MKSLVVDDDYTCAYIFQMQLSKYGESKTLFNGIDAIEEYKASINKGIPYNLIVLDIMMPNMNGYEVLKNIRLIEEERNISFPFNAKVILMTALDDMENRKIEQELDEFSETYLVKSNDFDSFFNKLNLFGFNLEE